MYLIYSFLYLLTLILLLPYFIYREIKSPRYFQSFSQRLGFLPNSLNPERKPSIWIQAVSVGEAIGVKPVIIQLRQKFPDLALFLSTTTMTGQSIAHNSQYPIDGIFYFPFDFSFICRRFLSQINPRLLVLMEGELWPNLLKECKKRAIKVIVINGRISPRSYKRYRAIRFFFNDVLDDIDIFCMQSEEDAQRIIDIGAERERVSVSGNLKFDQADFAISENKMEQLKELFPNNNKERIIVAGSTHPGEEEIILGAYEHLKRDYPNLRLILVPRHPERCPQIETVLEKHQLSYIKRSQLSSSSVAKNHSVYLIDTIGELSALYAMGYIVFVGGSLVPVGGHNILEPASLGKPVIFGRHMENFQFIASQCLELKAGYQVSNLSELIASMTKLLKDRELYNEMSQNAHKIIDENRGATEKTIKAIERLIAAIKR